MKQSDAWGKEFYREKLRRIQELEAPGYVFPPKMTVLDWSLGAVVIIASGILLIAGAWM